MKKTLIYRFFRNEFTRNRTNTTVEIVILIVGIGAFLFGKTDLSIAFFSAVPVFFVFSIIYHFGTRRDWKLFIAGELQLPGNPSKENIAWELIEDFYSGQKTWEFLIDNTPINSPVNDEAIDRLVRSNRKKKQLKKRILQSFE